MSGAAFFRVKKLKGGGIITLAARHNKREIQAEMGTGGSIDPTRARLNYALAGPAGAADVGHLAKELMALSGVGKLRKDAVLALEFVFSLPVGTAIDDRNYFIACTEWAGVAFGGVVLSAQVHHDETAPHCHVLMLPLIDGRMGGSDLVGGKQKLASLQKQFHAEVASKFGLSKAPARQSGAAKEAGAKAVLQKLRETGDSAMQSSAWAVIRDAVERDPGPFMLALGIELVTPKKPGRTMVQIFTSKGKGKAKETPNPIAFAPSKEPNPIGFEPHKKERTLCSVGFASKTTLSAQPPRPTSAPGHCPPAPATTPAPRPALQPLPDPEPEPLVQTTRIRDSDLDPERYDPDSGDYIPRKPPAPRQRDAADAWVSHQLRSDPSKSAGQDATP